MAKRSRKEMVKSTQDYANKLAKMTKNKKEAHVSVFRKALKIMVAFEATSILAYRKSPAMAIRREGVALAKKIKAKKAKAKK